jgi:hypothetical protein
MLGGKERDAVLGTRSRREKTTTRRRCWCSGSGSEEYAVDILKVQEIRGYEKVTPIPRAPDFLKGVVNLRGTIVPVIDLA